MLKKTVNQQHNNVQKVLLDFDVYGNSEGLQCMTVLFFTALKYDFCKFFAVFRQFLHLLTGPHNLLTILQPWTGYNLQEHLSVFMLNMCVFKITNNSEKLCLTE